MSTRSPDQSVKLTKSVVDKLTPPERGQRFVRDSQLKGFAARITASGIISFIVERRINGRVRRLTLGRYGELTCEQARREAQKVLGQIALGVDPQVEKRRARIRGTTLAECYQDFLKARKNLKERTLYDYGRLMEVAFKDWQGRPLTEITRDQISRRHRQLGQDRGKAYANLAMRFLRSLFTFAQATYEDGSGRALIADNPVAVLTQTRSWYRSERRQSVIKVHQMPDWYRGVLALGAGTVPDPVPDRLGPAPGVGRDVADYLLLLLFTGLRRQEGLTLRWENVDLKDRTLHIPDPKNSRPLTLPLSDFLCELLARRQGEAVNEYVFPGRDGRGHLVEPKRQVAHAVEVSGVHFTLHDLRRTFITVAESLDIAPYAIKRLVNHSMRNDVTAGYVVTDIERLRGPMQRITDFLRRSLEPDDATVVPFPAHRATD